MRVLPRCNSAFVYFSAKALVLGMLVCLLCLTPALLAQSSSTGTVSGTVTDSSGAVVADATVTLTGAATSSTRNTPTSDKGFYVFSSVDPGTYNVSITKAGFKTTVVAAQVVEVGRQLTVNATLEVGSVSST